MWWFAANLTTYLLGAAAYEFGKRVLDTLSISTQITAAFPLLGFLIYGVWMLWVTAPEATAAAGRPGHGTADTERRPRHPGLETERGEERHEHCTIPPGLFQGGAPSARRHRTAPSLGDHDRF